jgi:hypothetical protein
MSRVTPELRAIARRIIANMTPEDESSSARDAAAFHTIDELRPHLVTLMGNGGFRAVLSRALALASTEVKWLRAVHVKADGSLDGLKALHLHLGPEEFLEGRVFLLAELLGLLVAFVGPNLTEHLVGEIWPQNSPADLDFSNGGKNEETK